MKLCRVSYALSPIVSQNRGQAGRRCYVGGVAELARIPARELAQYRQRNEVPVRSALYFGVPTGFAIGFANTGVDYMLMGAGVFAVFAVLGLVHLIRNYPRGINAAQEEFRDGDYPTIAYIAPFIPIAAPLVMAPLSAAGLLPEVELAPPVAGMLSGAWWAFGLPLGIWGMFSQSFRIGRRRINKILEKDPLDGVTEARLELADAHSDILTALVAAGAVQAFVKVRRAGFKPSLNLLYALEGALLDCHWQEISDERRQELILAAEAATALLPAPRNKPAAAPVHTTVHAEERHEDPSGYDGGAMALDDHDAPGADDGDRERDPESRHD